ncbi:MAG: glycosyltransferase family 2 protein [Bacteroidales bacterium]
MNRSDSPELSVVITVFNERENIAPLVAQLQSALKTIHHEVIFVDDGSTDGTQACIRKEAYSAVKLVELRRNYGQSTAMTAGIDYAEGTYIALLDGDLQNDPADIPMMLEKLKTDDLDVVAGNRQRREDGMLLRKIPSNLANALIRRQTGIHLRDYGCTLKLFRSEIARNLGLYGELHRFIPVLASLQGASIAQVNVQHHARKFGHSKYGLNRTMRVASDLILILFFQKYMQKPMHLFGGLGLLLMLPGAGIFFYLFVLKLMQQDIGGKPILILGVVLLLMGFLFIILGIMSEILIRIYYESQHKKNYLVKNLFTFRNETR